MSHKWEYEDEYLQLKSDFRRAQTEGNLVRCEQLQPRIKELDEVKWRSKIASFPELGFYKSVVEALEQTALKLKVLFPDLTDLKNNTGDGKFIFGISDGVRTVQIWPLQSRGYYDVEVYQYDIPGHGDEGLCYRGQTTSLEEATIVLSRWFVERCSIDALHIQLPWMSRTPFQLSGPRMTFE
jgi:hypothetical protein